MGQKERSPRLKGVDAFNSIKERYERELAGLDALRQQAGSADARDLIDRMRGDLVKQFQKQARQYMAEQTAGGLRVVGKGEAPAEDLRPVVVFHKTALDAAATEATEVLLEAGCELYLLGGAAVEVDEERGEMADVSRDRLLRLLDRHIVWTGAGDERIEAPEKVARSILSSSKDLRLPPLRGIIRSPMLRPDLSVITAPGYDPATQLYYLPIPGEADRWVNLEPESYTWEMLDEDVRTLSRIIRQFPFANELHRAAALSYLLTCSARQAVDGNAPIFLFDASDRGCGKTLLANVGAILSSSSPLSPLTFLSDREEELDQQILSALYAGDRVICWDDVGCAFVSPSINKALTSASFAGRLKGKTQLLHLSTAGAVFAATGNRMQISPDIRRRAIRIHLMPGPDHLSKQDYELSPLPAYVADNRPELVSAALRIVRYCARAGERPERGFASFEQWSEVIRRAVIWITRTEETGPAPYGYDPLLTQDELEEGSDHETEVLGNFVWKWWTIFQESPLSTIDLLRDDGVREAAEELVRNPAKDLSGLARQVSNWLDKKAKGQIVKAVAGTGVRVMRDIKGRRWYLTTEL